MEEQKIHGRKAQARQTVVDGALEDTRGEVIGIVFDSNYEAMHNRFVYGMDRGERCVHVASNGIIEALRAVYGADRVLEELGFAKTAK